MAHGKTPSGKIRYDNGELHAGSPMYYYCMHCGELADVKPEDWVSPRPKKVCDECVAKGLK